MSCPAAIKNKPVRNEDPKDAKLREYQAEIERLRALISQRRTIDRRPRKQPKQRSQPAPSDNCTWTLHAYCWGTYNLAVTVYPMLKYNG